MRPSIDPKPKLPWKTRLREYADALKNVPRAFGMLWEADRLGSCGMAAVTAVGAAIPVSQAWVTKLIIDGVLGAIARHRAPEQGLRDVLPYLALEFGLIVANSAMGQFRSLIEELIDHRLGHMINTRIMRKALSLEAKYFEDPEFYDKMQNARRQSEFRAMALVRGGFMIAQNALTLISFLAVLLSFNAWVAGILFCAVIPAFINQSKYSRLSFRLQTWRTPETRSMNYLEQLLTLDTTVKEVKLFGLGEPLLKRHGDMFWKIFKEDAALARERSIKSVLWGLLASLSYYGAYAWIIFLTVAGRITLGAMTLYLTLFSQTQGAFQGLLDNFNSLFENGLFLDNLFGFLSIEPSVAAVDSAPRTAEDSGLGIEFKNVWFQYPGQKDWAIRDFSLNIRPGEKIALVGENGAGKTTLIKLLTRLYEPAKGAIYFHGVDVRLYPLEELHRRIGAIFQDYVRYQLSLSENIGFGAVEHLEDAPRIEKAAEKSGADEVARSLSGGFSAQLGRWFENGHELSGGQWQKVALGRAFMRDGEVLVLDEPTSSLDASAEYEIFQRFRSLSEGKIALLVSHRFSTVRMADRIAVLKDGQIEELGSHEELLERKGTYARLFELQASGYR